MTLKGHIVLMIEYIKLHLATAMEYKLNFIMQSFMMIINDLFWLGYWFLFYNRFDEINGWGFDDILMLYTILTITYGIMGAFFGGARKIATSIAEGQMDFILALPKNELLHQIVSKFSYTSFGDLVFGILLAFFVVSFAKIPLFLLLILLSTTIILSFVIMIGSLTFYIGSSESLATHARMSLVAIASYPFTIFEGLAKMILLFIIPAGFIGGVPVDLMRTFDIKMLSLMFVFAVLYLAFAVWFFNRGLRKYESGSMINVRL